MIKTKISPSPPSSYCSRRFLTTVDQEDLPYSEDECASFLLTLKFASAGSTSIVGINETLGTATAVDSNADSADSCSSCSSSVSTSTEEDEEEDQQVTKLAPAGHNYAGICISPALPSDQHWLSEVHCYLRKHCIEVFAATEEDVASRRLGGGRATNIDVGQVGVRCRFCQGLPPQKRATQSSSFPTKLSGLSTSVAMMQCRHFPSCTMVPQDVRDKIASISSNTSMVVSSSPTTSMTATPQKQHNDDGDNFDVAASTTTPSTCRWWNRGGSTGKHQYWISSAKKIGLIDTAAGIRFERDPKDSPLKIKDEASSFYDATVTNGSCLTSEIMSSATPVASSHARSTKSSKSNTVHQVMEEESSLVAETIKNEKVGEEPSSLVTEEDKQLIPDYLFVAMQQMIPCYLTEEDRVGCYKDRDTGFRGIACKHCGGMPGFGKYFPASVRSLAQTTTSQTIVKHVGAKCKRCPPHIRAAMVEMQQRARLLSVKSSTKASREVRCKPKYGSRKIFFQRVWGRLHDEHVPDIDHLQQEDEEEEEEGFSSAEENKSFSKKSHKVTNTTMTPANKRNIRKSSSAYEVSDSDNEEAPYHKRSYCRLQQSIKFDSKKRRVSEDDITW